MRDGRTGWMSRQMLGLAVVLAVVWGHSLCAGELRVCGSCGHEVPGAVCSHCGVAAPPRPGTDALAPGEAEDAAEPVPAAVLSESDQAWGRMVEADVAAARDHFHGGRPELAAHFCRNALAVNTLVEDAVVREGRMQELLRMREACEEAPHPLVARTCPVCEGSGRGVFEPKSIAPNARLSVQPAGTCKRCGGTGRISERETIDEITFRRARSLAAYRQLRLARSDVPIGECWVPRGADEGLSVKQRVALASAIPPLCERCLGTGRSDCTACHGRGLQACRARGCERGEVREEKQSLSKDERIFVKPCEACKGTGEESCTRCMGAGSEICKACNGTGEAPLCSRCGGRGLSECRTCKGSGRYRDAGCTACRGEGVAVCNSCNGCGRRR